MRDEDENNIVKRVTGGTNDKANEQIQTDKKLTKKR